MRYNKPFKTKVKQVGHSKNSFLIGLTSDLGLSEDKKTNQYCSFAIQVTPNHLSFSKIKSYDSSEIEPRITGFETIDNTHNCQILNHKKSTTPLFKKVMTAKIKKAKLQGEHDLARDLEKILEPHYNNMINIPLQFYKQTPLGSVPDTYRCLDDKQGERTDISKPPMYRITKVSERILN